ncbi:hypothetical protein EI94DRAFT_1800038 [Lactarius quietus]|nr:hypothetical protein EI94DRAFT_1800038 [Lactarius quietus]
MGGFMDGLAGLYLDGPLTRPFVCTGGCAYLLTRLSHRSRMEVILVDLERLKTVVRLTPAESGNDLWSWSPLGSDDREWILSSRGAPTAPSKLAIGMLEKHAGRPRVTLRYHQLTPRMESALRELRATVIERYPIGTILIEPKRRKSQPLMTPGLILGGPHGQIPAAFSPAIAVYALQGFTEYTQYTGFEDFDEGEGEHGPAGQCVTRGSHGGFLTGLQVAPFHCSEY